MTKVLDIMVIVTYVYRSIGIQWKTWSILRRPPLLCATLPNTQLRLGRAGYTGQWRNASPFPYHIMCLFASKNRLITLYSCFKKLTMCCLYWWFWVEIDELIHIWFVLTLVYTCYSMWQSYSWFVNSIVVCKAGIWSLFY